MGKFENSNKGGRKSSEIWGFTGLKHLTVDLKQ